MFHLIKKILIEIIFRIKNKKYNLMKIQEISKI